MEAAHLASHPGLVNPLCVPRHPNPQNQVIALCNAGLAQHKLGRVDGARECCRSALDIAVASGDSSGEMLASGLLGLATAQSKPLRPVSREDDAGVRL